MGDLLDSVLKLGKTGIVLSGHAIDTTDGGRDTSVKWSITNSIVLPGAVTAISQQYTLDAVLPDHPILKGVDISSFRSKAVVQQTKALTPGSTLVARTTGSNYPLVGTKMVEGLYRRADVNSFFLFTNNAYGTNSNATQWAAADLSHCEQASTCQGCTFEQTPNQVECVWCSATKTCTDASSATCLAHITDPQFCPQPTCDEYKTCEQCVADTNCGYCLNSSSCVERNQLRSCLNSVVPPITCPS